MGPRAGLNTEARGKIFYGGNYILRVPHIFMAEKLNQGRKVTWRA
jgi:hypothetical protein